MRHLLHIAWLIGAVCVAGGSIAAQGLEGATPADEGGAPGYRHGMERSRFVTGATVEQLKPVEEFGFSKVIGRDGVFATHMRNGLVIAARSDGADKSEVAPQPAETESKRLLTPDEHNAMVMEYFTAAGIPRQQVRGIHANTYLSASGPANSIASLRPKIDGYLSVIERVVADKFLVAESVAWARLDADGKSIAEWVYWPAIPAKAIEEARMLDEMTTGARKDEFLRRLPSGLREGSVVIHHTSAVEDGPFEALATFDVIEIRGQTTEGSDNMSKIPKGMAIVRHFDATGAERRLSSERLNLGESDPALKE